MKTNTWTKIKNKIKDNPESASFYATSAVFAAGIAAFAVYAVRESNKQIAEYNQAVEDEQKWVVGQLSRGRLITYLPDGTPWSFDPTKPLIEAV